MNLIDYKLELLKNCSAATARTLSKNKNLNISFSNSVEDSLVSNNNDININLKKLTDPLEIRGKIDYFSYIKRFFDKKIFNQFVPTQTNRHDLFRLIHNVRSLTLGIFFFPGSFKNIKTFFDKEGLNFYSLQSNTEINNYIHFLLNFLLERNIIDKVTKPKTEIVNFSKKLKYSINDNKKFSKYSLEIVNIFFKKEKENSIDENLSSQSEQQDNSEEQRKVEKKEEYELKSESEQAELDLLNFKENHQSQNFEENYSEVNKKLIKKLKSSYSVFTKRFDLVAYANNLAKKSELNILKKN